MGGPPADATPGGSVGTGDKTVSGITGPDANGYYTFTSASALSLPLTGTLDTQFMVTWGGQPYLAVDLDVKDDTSVGPVRVVLSGTSSGGAGVGGSTMPVQQKRGILAFPPGLNRFRVDIKAEITSGSIKIRLPVALTPQSATEVDPAAVPKPTDTGVPVAIDAFIPAIEGTPIDGDGAYRFVAGDKWVFLSENVVTGTGARGWASAAVMGSTFNMKGLSVYADRAAYTPGQPTGNGSLTLIVTGRKADGTAQQLVSVGSSRVDLQACKLEYSIVSPK